MDQGDQTWYQTILLLKVRVDKLLLEHLGLPHVLDFAVHLVNFFGCMSQGGHSEPLLLLALFYQRTPQCDFSVSQSPFGLDFGTLDFGILDLGLTKILSFPILGGFDNSSRYVSVSVWFEARDLSALQIYVKAKRVVNKL